MADQSNEMVERVAQAIVANGIGELCWDVISDEHAEMAMRQARAAIRAVRYCPERLPDPLDAGIDAALSHDEVKA